MKIEKEGLVLEVYGAGDHAELRVNSFLTGASVTFVLTLVDIVRLRNTLVALVPGVRRAITAVAAQEGRETLEKVNAQEEPFDEDGAIMDYEGGEISSQRLLKLFSSLVMSGRAWRLQGSYGRMARQLISDGYLTETGEITDKGRAVSD